MKDPKGSGESGNKAGTSASLQWLPPVSSCAIKTVISAPPQVREHRTQRQFYESCMSCDSAVNILQDAEPQGHC